MQSQKQNYEVELTKPKSQSMGELLLTSELIAMDIGI